MKEQKNGERKNKDERNVQNGHTNTYLKNSIASKTVFFNVTLLKTRLSSNYMYRYLFTHQDYF